MPEKEIQKNDYKATQKTVKQLREIGKIDT